MKDTAARAPTYEGPPNIYYRAALVGINWPSGVPRADAKRQYMTLGFTSAYAGEYSTRLGFGILGFRRLRILVFG